MLKIKSTLLAAALLVGVGDVSAQDNGALLDLLVRKGIVTDQEADDLRADLANQNATALVSTSKGNFLEKVTLSGRYQIQFVNLSANTNGSPIHPASTNHFLLRRIYVGVKAQMSGNWTAYLNYDFAGSTFDQATITWKQSDVLLVDAGLKKAPIGYEEVFTSSGSLKAIERSPATRFFVESNNGRRLGAGSYHQGIFAGSTRPTGLNYNVAVTNPERDESFTGAAGLGNNTNNNFSWWGNLSYNDIFGESQGLYKFGVAYGALPDQGGKTLGAGNNLYVYAVYADFTYGCFNIAGEYFGSKNEQGISVMQDSKSWAYWVQPAYRIGPHEFVVRYAYVDSDGRGVQTSDGIRSAPSGGTMDKLSEWYFGANWYLQGNEVKLQLGYLHGESKDTVTGGSAKATTDGVRSQLQLSF